MSVAQRSRYKCQWPMWGTPRRGRNGGLSDVGEKIGANVEGRVGLCSGGFLLWMLLGY